MSGDVLSVAVADVVRLAGRVDAVSDAVGVGVGALSVAPPADGLGLLVGAIVSPVLDVFTQSAHEVLSGVRLVCMRVVLRRCCVMRRRSLSAPSWSRRV